MPEDIDPTDRIPALLAEYEAVAGGARAAKRQAQIASELKAAGYKGSLPSGTETADQPTGRRRGAAAASEA